MLHKLKPVPRMIVILLIVGAIGAGVSYALKKSPSTSPSTPSSGGGIAGAISSVMPSRASSDDLKVSLVSFHGYAPGLVANGNALITQPGSIYERLGVKINFIIQDDIPTLATIFESKTAHCAWRTSDFWAQEQPNLRNAGMDAKAVMIVDNTQGGDAIITKDPSINSIEDLAGKTIAMLQFTPSHGMTIDAIENSSLTGRRKSSVRYVFINADEGTAGVRAALESGKVDAAVLWDPDLSLAIKNTGARVVYSTKQATNLIFDVMVCDTRVLNDPVQRERVQKFVNGWMEGVKAARANPDGAVQALVNTQEMFKLINQQQGPAFIKGLFSNVVWTGLEDNMRILGLDGGTNHYERVYQQFDQIYRAAGALANPNSPVINPQDSFDYGFIRTAVAAAGPIQATQEPTFTTAARDTARSVAVTKPVFINFDSGSAELTQRARKVIDDEMVPFIENNGAAYIELSGNADSTGSEAVNRPLSFRRAQAVADYLVKQWEIPAARIKVVGNGSSKPICQEPGTADGLTLEECRALNRTTRVGVLSR
jgi:outer membrane protein OmpA-like peptidoglycan-associated protein/ABC-type amino acid transport substrate-binding protein